MRHLWILPLVGLFALEPVSRAVGDYPPPCKKEEPRRDEARKSLLSCFEKAAQGATVVEEVNRACKADLTSYLEAELALQKCVKTSQVFK